MRKDSFVFYKSFFEAIQNIPKENQLEVYEALCTYSFTGEIPKIDGIAKAMFILMKPNIDKANARYEASVNNGKKGGRPRKTETQEKPNQNLDKTQEKPNQNLNVDVDVYVDKDNYTNKDNSNKEYIPPLDEKKTDSATAPSSSEKKKKEAKQKYGEYNHVLLTDTEAKKLVTDYGKEKAEAAITFLDEYIEMKGYKAKSHYLCIRKWVFDALKEKEQRQKRGSGNKKNQFNDFPQRQYSKSESLSLEQQLLSKSKGADHD